MATTFISGIVGTLTIGPSDNLIITQDGLITSPTNGVTDTGYNTTVSVFGEIHAGGYGVRLDNTNGSDAGSHAVNVGEGGVINSSNGNAVFMAGNVNSLSNNGEITSDVSSGFAAVYLAGDNANVLNTGVIWGAYGISNLGTNATDSLDVINHGSIYGAQYGIFVSTQNLDLFNAGTIQGLTNVIRMATSGTNAYIVNTGLIETADGIAVSLNSGDDNVINTGTIIGHILMGDGADTFDGRGGTVIGTVSGDQGDDSYYISDSNIELLESSGFGTDTVYSTVSYGLVDNFENLTLIGSGNTSGYGNGEDNTLVGNIGDNILRGKAGADTVNGGDGEDRLYGGGGGDTLGGGADDDVLRGGKGNDTLNGGGENDVLIGGTGKDNLTGGSGEDVFRFVKANHSLNSSLADSILDFTSGDDLIDLGTFAGKFKFIGSSALSGDAEVRVTEAGGNSTVRVDVDGDGVADMKIKVLGVIGLDALDFLL